MTTTPTTEEMARAVREARAALDRVSGLAGGWSIGRLSRELGLPHATAQQLRAGRPVTAKVLDTAVAHLDG